MASVAPESLRPNAVSKRPSKPPSIGMRLEDLKRGQHVLGIVSGATVELRDVNPVGRDQVEVIYKLNGTPGEVVLSRLDEPRLKLADHALPWSFSADPELFRLAAEAERIQLAWFFDPYLAIESSRVEPLPHQVAAVYQEMLTRMPLRFLLADDPGAGKTIMAGLLVKELILRAELERCLIVAPGSLVEQWQDELHEKFDLEFQILSRQTTNLSRTGNPFSASNGRSLWIARVDQLARGEDLQDQLGQGGEWDLVIVDEAHKMSAPYFGGERKPTKRYKLGERLAEVARHLLLMTATPHNGKEEDFQSFLMLLDKDRFEGKFREKHHKKVNASDLMRRCVKEELRTFKDEPLFPQRVSSTVHYELSQREKELYDEVTNYVRNEMNRADRLGDDAKKRRSTVGFALQTLQRRLASSPEAILTSLARRQRKLEERATEIEAGTKTWAILEDPELPADFDSLDDDDLSAEELEARDELCEASTAAQTLPELRAEIEILKDLVGLATQLRNSGEDVKWTQLRDLLEKPEMYRKDGTRRKLVIFSESRDTLLYLQNRMRSLLGRQEAVEVIHGGINRHKRKDVVARFNHSPELVVLIANDAAGEGVNLHKGANLMVNYDLPWNPNRLEQRFGRVHRIGQKEVCYLWNLTAKGTREGDVYARLLDKLDKAREALGGKVYDVLGEVFENRPLRELLMEAVREDRPGRDKDIEIDLDKRLEHERLKEILDRQGLVTTRLADNDIKELNESMDRAKARKLQPHFIEGFFVEAFQRHGGQIAERGNSSYELAHVPSLIISKARALGPALSDRYQRIFFDRTAEKSLPQGSEWVTPGHPLLDAVVELSQQQWSSTLQQGAVLIDDDEAGVTPRLVIQLQLGIEDSLRSEGGKENIVSRHLLFLEMMPDGTVRRAGHAPFLDLRTPNPLERGKIEALRREGWLKQSFSNLERGPWRETIKEWASNNAVGEVFAEFCERRLSDLQKVEEQVTKRLRAEIRHWDRRASQEGDKVRQGKGNKLNVDKWRKRVERLQSRLDTRLHEIGLQKQLRPRPIYIQAAALVVPRIMLHPKESERPSNDKTNGTEDLAAQRARIERVAMQAVIRAEEKKGSKVRDTSALRGEGYDLESVDTSGRMKFLEVKGYAPGTVEISLSKNEILKSKNCPIRFRVILVQVDGERVVSMHELKGYDFGELGFQQTRGTFSLKGMLEHAKPIS